MKRTARLIHFTTVVLAVLMILDTLFMPVFTRREQLVIDAMSHLGVRYSWGQKGPDYFDCSGLMVHCYGQFGIELPHSAELIGTTSGYRVLTRPYQLLVGDIVSFNTVDDFDPSDHVGIWIGGNRFIHASSTQGKVVISELEDFYLETFTGGRRLLCPCY